MNPVPRRIIGAPETYAPDASARYRSMQMLESLCEQHSIHTIVSEGDPISKARPRFSQGHKPYTPLKTIQGEKRLASLMVGIPKFKGNVAVACVFYRSTRQRIDVDNLLKAVLDAGTRAHIWDDDSQVTAIVGVMEHDHDRPRTVVSFGQHVSTMKRGDCALIACETCGKLFAPLGTARRKAARWCSVECRTVLAAPVPCPACKKPFRRRTAGNKFCSLACRGVAQGERDRRARATRTHCVKGHVLDEANTHILPNGGKRCRLCQSLAAAIHRQRRNP